jgi:Right handed beta helix region
MLSKPGTKRQTRNTRISRFKAGIGAGIHVNNSSDGRVYVTDTVISDSGAGNSGGGIVIQPTGSGQAFVALSRVTLSHNSYGIFAQGLGTSGPIVAEVRDSSVAGSFFHGIFAATDASTAGVLIDRSTLALSAGNGIMAQGAGALVHLSNSTVRGNSVGLGASGGGQIISFQNNQIAGNGTDGAPTGVLTVK